MSNEKRTITSRVVFRKRLGGSESDSHRPEAVDQKLCEIEIFLANIRIEYIIFEQLIVFTPQI